MRIVKALLFSLSLAAAPLFTGSIAQAQQGAAGERGAQCQTIVEIAQDTDALSTLVQAVGQAGLVDALDGPDHVTVFAPVNDAFAELAALPSGDALENVLLFHVTKGDRRSQSVVNANRIRMLNGGEIRPDGTTLEAPGSSAEIVQADIVACNGIVHVIDTVLLP